jgi:hypothetical protein
MLSSMNATIFTEFRFWALVSFSLVLPSAIFFTLFVRRAFSKTTVLVFGLLLVAMASVDLVLLRALSNAALATPSLADDRVFASELSIALYILPAAFGTLGINMASHVLMHYLRKKEQRFEATHPAPAPPGGIRSIRRRIPPGRALLEHRVRPLALQVDARTAPRRRTDAPPSPRPERQVSRRMGRRARRW